MKNESTILDPNPLKMYRQALDYFMVSLYYTYRPQDIFVFGEALVYFVVPLKYTYRPQYVFVLVRRRCLGKVNCQINASNHLKCANYLITITPQYPETVCMDVLYLHYCAILY